MIDLRAWHGRERSMAQSGRPVRVFIIEDNDPDVFLIQEAMRSQGIAAQLQRCYDGEEAICLLSQIEAAHLPDIIIIDLNLPKITGMDILKHARGLHVLNGVPILILTSSQSNTDRALSIELGADAYIAKPPTLPDFLLNVGSGIRTLLERTGRRPCTRLHFSIFSYRRSPLRIRSIEHARHRPRRLRAIAGI